jgi:acetylornithine/succinyldiaminopimelate/putrescine aminotransferase
MAPRLRRQDLAREDRRRIGRHGSAKDIVVASAKGSYVHDARGRTYLDFQMGWCVGNLGWNNPEIVERLRAFRGPAYVHPSFLYPPAIELAKRLSAVVPTGLARAYRAVGGTEAVELALQLATAFTGRSKFVSLAGAYHGNSIAARSIGESGKLAAKLSGCKQLGLPLELDRLETLLRRRDVAAFVMEPIVLNLGVVIPEPEFMEGASELCERYGTQLVMDEVACGFGRTGKLFASEHYDLRPDILCLGKAITSGHAPLAATLCTAEIAEAVRGDFGFYSTYGWHPLGVEAALATLDYFERNPVLENVEDVSGYFLSRLLQMPWDEDVEVRVKGLAIAIDCGDVQYVSRLAERCREDGLLVGDEDETLVMYPALTIDRATAKAGLDILEQAI